MNKSEKKIKKKVINKYFQIVHAIISITTKKVVGIVASIIGGIIIFWCLPCTIYTNIGTVSGFYADPYHLKMSMAMGVAWTLYCFTRLPKFGFIGTKISMLLIFIISSIAATSTINLNSNSGLQKKINNDLTLQRIEKQINFNSEQINILNKSIEDDRKWYKHYKFSELNNPIAQGFRLNRLKSEKEVLKLTNLNDSLFTSQSLQLDTLKMQGSDEISAMTNTFFAFIPLFYSLPVKRQHTIISIMISFINDMLIRFGSNVIIFYNPNLIIPLGKKRKKKSFFKRKFQKLFNKLPVVKQFLFAKKIYNKNLEKIYVDLVNNGSNNDKMLLQKVDTRFDFVTVGSDGRIIRKKETTSEEKKQYIFELYNYLEKNNLKLTHDKMEEVILYNFGVTIRRSTITTYLNRDIKPNYKYFQEKYPELNKQKEIKKIE